MKYKRVLIIEKDKAIQDFFNDQPIAKGYKTIIATTSSQARTCLTDYKQIDIAIISVDAYKHLDRIIDDLHARKVAVILIGGEETPGTKSLLLEKHVFEYINKDKEGLSRIPILIRTLEKNRSTPLLIIDDSDMFRGHIADILRQHQFPLIESSNGRDALDIIKKRSGIKLVITDYEMPEMKGLELIQNVRAHFDMITMPIIVVSNYAVVDCLKSGANDFLHKPFTSGELLNRLYLTLATMENISTLNRQKLLLEHYKKVIDQNTIVLMMDANGIITYISEAYVRISGYHQKELSGRHYSFLYHSDTPASLTKKIHHHIRMGKSWAGEFKNRTKHDGYFWLKTHLSPDRNDNGAIIGYTAISQDITAEKDLKSLSKTLEKRVAEELEKNRKQTSHMLQQSRLAQMGEMISMIAHQWRQPLASISAIAGTLTLDIMMDAYKKEFFAERLEAISSLSQHLSTTIDDFRGFFKNKKDKESVSWEAMVLASMKIIGPALATKNITIRTEFTDTRAIETFPNEIRQVILNIIKNAEDTLIDKETANATIWIRSHACDKESCLSIEDNGGGIPEKFIDKIFDPYFSTKEKKDGTGLGLYMSKTIIEEHCGGRLNVCNTKLGALFEIILPAKAEEAT